MPLLNVNDGNADRPPQNNFSRRFLVTATLEIVLIVICFAMFAGQAAPNVNESHYLTKAKHFWNPDYCPGDLFLSSSFSHLAFYTTTGWLTKWVSLSTYAWIGRWVTWTLIAAGWWRVCRHLLDMPLMSVLTAALLVILNQRFHLAGEWVVGGFEAKGFAYGFVLLAISDLLQQRWHRVWPWLGAASMFHVLVGGWSTIAAIACWLFSLQTAATGNRSISTPASSDGTKQAWIRVYQGLRNQAVPLTVGFGLALIGILPPLLAEGGGHLQQRANAIYVTQRISHHLDFGSFSVTHICRFVLMGIVWFHLSRWVRTTEYRNPTLRRRFQLLAIFTATTLVFSLTGLALSAMAEQGGDQAVFANQFLRFYLFRLADFSVPASLALICGRILSRWTMDRSNLPRQVFAIIFIGGIIFAAVALVQQNHLDGRPKADARTLPYYPGDKKRSDDVFKNWKRVCHWINQNTPSDAVFITPIEQQTFKWYAGRSEVCNWKDVPQDPSAMVKWKQRIDQLIAPQRDNDLGIFVYSDQQLRLLAANYGATHLLAKQSQSNALSTPTLLRQIYPNDRSKKTTWVVYTFAPQTMDRSGTE